jgi:hypothetical protein
VEVKELHVRLESLKRKVNYNHSSSKVEVKELLVMLESIKRI